MANRKTTTARTSAVRRLIISSVLAILFLSFLIGADIHVNAQASAAAKGTTVITVGITGTADEPIWKAVQEELDSRGANITVKLVSLQDGTKANELNASGELQLTAFQHYAYFNDVKEINNLDITAIANTYIMPLNLYSFNYDDPADIPAGGKVAIPADATNQGRALKVLHTAGLIVLDDPTKPSPTLQDITANPSGIEIVPTDAPNIINLLPDYAAGITNTNHVLDAGYTVDDAIYHEPVDINSELYQPYINLIGTRTADVNNADYQQIVSAYHTPRVAQAILDTYNGAVLPAFEY